ncbi:MAG: hypothetical protein WBM39_01480 [Parasphingorhabdus sp.]
MKSNWVHNIGLAGAAGMLATMPASAQTQEPAIDPLQTEILEKYGILAGQWHPDPASLPEAEKKWRTENNVTDNWIEFSWGSDHQWMVFGDWQMKDGETKHSGAGLVAYDPSGHRVLFTEHGIRGASVLGTLSKPSENEIVRDIVVTRTDKSWRQIDRWIWDGKDPQCFIWSATYITGDKHSEGTSKKWCRRTAGQ